MTLAIEKYLSLAFNFIKPESVNLKKTLTGLVCIFWAFSSCKKSSPATTQVKSSKDSVETPGVFSYVNVDVYLTGTATPAIPNNVPEAGYWKNGVLTTFKDTSYLDSHGYGLALSGKDIYVVGNVHIGINNVAAYWINGTVKKLASASTSSHATSIVKNNNGVFIAGSATSDAGNEVACYWQNEVLNLISNSSGQSSSANAIAVSGNDVYTAGYSYDFNTHLLSAVYWKNGVATILATDGIGATANGIAINGADIYVVGVSKGVAACWKNGTQIELKDVGSNSVANAITIVNDDVYIVGSIGGIATLWKNGIASTLPGGEGSNEQFVAKAIAVNNTNVYVGEGFNQSGYYIFWENGVPYQLTKENVEINSVVVVPR